MKNRRTSGSKNCIFVLPASDTVELLINYKGLEWSNENINEQRLRNFSQNCEGFNISFFENINGKILMFSRKGENEDSLSVHFEGIFMEELPCAFFDKDSKIYDNFSVPSSTTEMIVSIGSDAIFTIEWEVESEETTIGKDEDDDIFYEENDIPVNLTQRAEKDNEHIVVVFDEKKDLSAENENPRDSCQELSSENERLRTRIRDLDSQVSKLESRIQELERSTSEDTNTEDKDKEIIELNRLIRQLVDDHFDGQYVETMDEEINSLTASITKQRDVLKEKEASKEKLNQDLQEIEGSVSNTKEEITRLMVCIDKAEAILSENSIELGEKQERIKEMLDDLGMDMETLELYSTDGSLESILSEASDIKDRLEENLKFLIQERQKDCDERSNRLKGNS